MDDATPDPAPTLRAETPSDVASIRRVNDLAFGQPAEGELVDALRAEGALALSLVAVRPAGAEAGCARGTTAYADPAARESGTPGATTDEVVGHIAFSPVTIAGCPGAWGLAPMAVVPGRQRQGLGSALVREGLARAAAAGVPAVVVLGHPGYYPRFGFRPASRWGLRCRWPVPDEAFLALELRPGALSPAGGLVHYHPAFDRFDA